MARHFDDWLQAFMEHTRASEAPSSFHLWTGISTIAGALRRRVWIDMRHFQWTPNFYIIFVGPPGIVTKSTAIGAGHDLLSKVDGIRFGPESMTWQALGLDLQEAIEYVKYKDAKGVEQLQPMSALTIPVSELGTFLNMEDTKAVSFLIEMWDGKNRPFRHRTKDSGNIDIENPWLNVIGCTTPAWLQVNFGEGAIGGGLASRVIWVYGDKKRHLVAYPDEAKPAKEYYEYKSLLIEDLREIADLAGQYELTSGARRWGHAWYERHWSSRPAHMASQRFEGYLGRKQTHIHKIAMVLSAAETNSLHIDAAHLKKADELLELTEQDMLKVFESVGVVEEAQRVGEIVSFVRAHRCLTSQELWQFCQNIMPLKVFKESLTAAVESQKLKIVMKNGQRAVELIQGK